MKAESYFVDHKKVIENELLIAEKDVKIAVAWINFKEYLALFKALLLKSVKLTIICSDNWQNRSHQKEIDELTELKAEIILLKMSRKTNHMHHKFAIIDNKTILNGSFNWSPNAVSSIENIIVLRDFPDVVTSFLDEFGKLSLIKQSSIRLLLNNTKCKEKKCKGKLYNILVLSKNQGKTHENIGDIIEICNCCDYFKKIDYAIEETEIDFLVQTYDESMDDFETELLDRAINQVLNQFVVGGTLIHAIGRVNSGLDYYGDDYAETYIIWKNKFVGSSLPNTFETDFDVSYDN